MRHSVIAVLVGTLAIFALGGDGPAVGVPALQAQASDDFDASDGVRVYLDCQSWRNCDRSHFRTEIDYVDWVRDRADANVHLIFTSTGAGSGRHYQLDFGGRGSFDGLEDRLTYTSRGDDVQSEVMDRLTHTLQLGLVRYLVAAGMGEELALEYLGEPVDADGESPGNGAESPAATEDPWDYWTFRFGLSGSMDIQERRDRSNFRPTVAADRVTDRWKVNLNGRLDMRRERIELSSGEEVRNDRNTWRASALVVRSVSDHFSVGVDTEARRSIQRNQDVRLNFAPALEWNYYPYAEANRRQFIAHYGMGFEYADYLETTIFEQEREMIPRHRVAVQYNAREDWGNARAGFETAQYLHDASLYSAGFRGNINYRIRRGLELELSGSASYVNDQIYVPQDDADDQDVLLGRSALPTGYEYEASIGFNYRFGSVFDNIVNNRFPGSVR